MARIVGYLHGEEVYNVECNQTEVDKYIQTALSSWCSIDDMGNVEVTNDDGYVWCPV